MTSLDLFQILLYLAVLTALVKPLGAYMARVYQDAPVFLEKILGPLERGLYKLAGVDPQEEMGWKAYARAVLLFNFAGLALVYALQRLQHLLPLNPDGLGAVAPYLAFNTAASFVSNTNWQNYSGETTLSYLTQMLGLTVQNFLSAATGMAVCAALIRGIVRQSSQTIGNYWRDLIRSVLYILLPLSLGLALLLVAQGVPQTLSPAIEVQPFASFGEGEPASRLQVLALGPVASQVAIKQLGTNGGGYYGVNSAHPFENPTPLGNFFQAFAILLIPAGLTYTYGRMVGDTRQGWAIFIVMSLLFVGMLSLAVTAEASGNPRLTELGVDQVASEANPGGNMTGKEVRNGPVVSALWATATTAASNGSVNSMHNAYMPLGALSLLWLMQLGEVVFGGVGSGLYGMLAFVIVAVFVAGLMVGRTPEYVGKKIEAFEMKMASLVILIPPIVVLLGTALAVSLTAGQAAPLNAGPRAFSEILYAFSSAGNNNGSAFAGLNGNNWLYNTALGVAMLVARYWLIIPILALAGSLARKSKVPQGAGTLPTHTPLFIGWLMAIVILVGALSFLPALALGPIVEQLYLAR